MSWIDNKTIGWDGHIQTVYRFDPASEQSFLQYRSDPTAILENNHQLRSERPVDGALGRKVASIDPVIYMEWCRLAGVPVSRFMQWKRQEKVAFLKKFLNDPDWYKFRTVEGKV